MERNPHQRVKASRGVKNQTNATGGESQASSPDLEERYREIHDRYDKEFQIYYDQEQYGLASVTATKKQSQNSTSSKSKGSRHLSNRKPDNPREDIIERNRVTLGINTAKEGSYLRAHAQQKEVSDTTEEITIGGSQEKESQEDNSDPELRHSGTDSQSSILDTRPHQCQHIPLTQPPTVHLNINLNTSSELLPFLQHNHQDVVLTITSPCSGPGPQWKLQSTDGYRPNANVALRNAILVKPDSHPSTHSFPQDGSVQLTLIPQAAVSPPSPGWGSRCRQGFPGMPPLSQGSREPLHLWHQENAPWQRENHIVLQYDDEDSHTSTYTSQTQHSSGSYTVLPSIGRIQLLENKASSLKDYKQLKQDVNLGGLSPDYTTTEITLKTREPEWAQEGPRGHSRLLEGFDLSQLATLEALRKRQEQEKQTVAHFKVVHAI
ncbi:unnamed protein product [Coregonus sp. 'balchen']|nr:unnamed protein product [Coregonus sp. 'balchen']